MRHRPDKDHRRSTRSMNKADRLYNLAAFLREGELNSQGLRCMYNITPADLPPMEAGSK